MKRGWKKRVSQPLLSLLLLLLGRQEEKDNELIHFFQGS